MRLLRILLLLPALASAAEQIDLPTEARLWLRVPDAHPPLSAITTSTGSIANASWEANPARRQRLSDIQFPIVWWDWRPLTITFTPAHDGPIELSLTGPWQASPNGSLLRQEIHWDDLTATGTSVLNGGFESPGTPPEHWKSPWKPYAASSEWPLAAATPRTGRHLAASWHDRPLQQTLQVEAGKPVTLTVHARAVTPPGFSPPKRLPGNTPAHHAIAKLRRGVNLGNCWEAPPPYQWGIRFTPQDIDQIAAQGFDHIRVPVAWHFHLKPTPDGSLAISPELLADLEPVLRRAIDKNLHILLDWHHFHDLTSDPDAHRQRFIDGWKTITRHFQNWPDSLLLELLNEPTDALTTQRINPIHAAAIAAIREISPHRILVVSPGKWGSIRELDHLHLPDADDRIAVTVHCYEPYHFTHQGAGWVGLAALLNVRYPGPPESPLTVPPSLRDDPAVAGFLSDYNTLPTPQNPSSPKALAALLDHARAWSDHFGRPIHLGEFGSHDRADAASRHRHAQDVRTLAEARRIPWTLWDWKAAFRYWDTKNNAPLFREALFEKP